MKSLMLMVRKRVTHATATINQFDDPDVIDREMRFLRPFWEFIAARQKLNLQRFWESRRKDAFASVKSPIYRVTPLVWIPDRSAVCEAMQTAEDREQKAICAILRGIDIVLYNFNTLLSRSRYSLGIEDPESFQIVTKEAGDIGSYRILRHTVKRTAETGEEYRIITTRFVLPDDEEIKIEKDYSQSPIDPEVEIRLWIDQTAKKRGEKFFEYQGLQSQLNQRTGRLKTLRM